MDSVDYPMTILNNSHHLFSAYNCSAVLQNEFGTNSSTEDFKFSNNSFFPTLNEEFPVDSLNCTNFHKWQQSDICNVTDELCMCIRELNVLFCLSNLTNADMSWEMPLYYTFLYRAIGTIIQATILIVGVIGNLMVVYVVVKNDNMSTPTNCYLVNLAAADCLVLLAAVPQEIFGYYLAMGQWVHGQFGCSLLVFLQNLGINSSSLCLTAFTVEKYIAICHPMKAQTMCTVARAKRITRLVWLLAILYCSPWMFLTTVIHIPLDPRLDFEAWECTFKLSRDQYLAYYFIDFVAFYVVPLVISVVLYTLITVILFKPSPEMLGNRNGPKESYRSNQKKSDASRIQVVKMLVAVVIVFATLWLPYRAMLVYNSILAMVGQMPYKDLWFMLFAKTCIFINCAINPILYNAMSVKFRRAFRTMAHCGREIAESRQVSRHGKRNRRSRSTQRSTSVTTTSLTYNTPRGTRHYLQSTVSGSRYDRPLKTRRSTHSSISPTTVTLTTTYSGLEAPESGRILNSGSCSPEISNKTGNGSRSLQNIKEFDVVEMDDLGSESNMETKSF